METYTLVLESQLGPRQGCLRMEEQDGAVTGTLTLLGYDNAVQGRRTGCNTVRLWHHLRTLVSDLTCVSDLVMEHGKIIGTLRSGRAAMKLHGEQQTDGKAGKDKNE